MLAAPDPLLPWLGPSPTPPPTSSPPSHLILFDIDGTLLSCSSRLPGANRVQEEAFSFAARTAWGLPGGLHDVEHSGKTDLWILRELHEKLGGPAPARAAAVAAAAAAMEAHVRAAEAAGSMAAGLQVLPGVAALLPRLLASNAALGLVTGNLQAIAWAKLSAAGLPTAAFCCGGFGSDAEDRAVLVLAAVARARAALGGAAPLRVTHVGDTVRDVEAAWRAGVRSVAVATGRAGEAELRAEVARLSAEGGGGGGAGGPVRYPAVVLPGLADGDAFCRAVGLPSA